MKKALFVTALMIATAAASYAQTTPSTPGDGSVAQKWKKDHPRRAEVNARLANQNQRINQEVKEGEISKSSAAKVHKDDRKIRREEQLMASQNGGHITKGEQKTLNRQENAVSQKIGK